MLVHFYSTHFADPDHFAVPVIPYKIDVIETIVSEEEKKEDIYGGGEFNLSIIRYLDQ